MSSQQPRVTTATKPVSPTERAGGVLRVGMRKEQNGTRQNRTSTFPSDKSRQMETGRRHGCRKCGPVSDAEIVFTCRVVFLWQVTLVRYKAQTRAHTLYRADGRCLFVTRYPHGESTAIAVP